MFEVFRRMSVRVLCYMYCVSTNVLEEVVRRISACIYRPDERDESSGDEEKVVERCQAGTYSTAT